MKRSKFVVGTLGGLALVANTNHFFARALADTLLPGLPGAQNRVLVLLNLQGGNDGLNCVVPHGDPLYYQLRPHLAIPASSALHLNERIGFNPAMRSLKGLYDSGMLAVVQGVGYPQPNHSHFRSTEIWQTAAPDRYEHTGWLGRYLDESGAPTSELFSGVAISQVLPEVMIGDRVNVPSIPNARGYGFVSNRNATVRNAFVNVVGDGGLPFHSPYLPHVMEIAQSAQQGAQELPKLIAGYRTAASYPATPLGRSLALAAQIAAKSPGTKVLYIAHGSFDTHVNQQPTQSRLLAELSDALKAFYDDLHEHGNDRRVLTMTFSEFGRRIAQNGSGGTDHGEASPLFLLGGGVKGGIYGQYPDLANHDSGNLRFTTDFRSVYATVLERWLGRSSQKILAGSFPTLPILG
ncbi:MAG TPA: DUF1501 domain-containing protein [Candidatus Dormibacteraeota bacterium]|nr:DUF1501 domain-containing protein [Candidatus Dormibacteraeota bacterium]